MNGNICTKCKTNISTDSHQYCYSCLRIARGQSPEPRYRRDTSNKTMCSRCKVEPRLSYHNYCAKCKNESTKKWAHSKGGWWNAIGADGREKHTVRRFINHKVERGTIERKPCEVCGAPSEFHHLDYEPRTLNVRNLCRKHHVEEERKKLTCQKDCANGQSVPLE